jgi:hypothetical protein
VLFHQIGAEPELEHEIDAYLDQRFTDNRTVLVRALNDRQFQLREAHPEVGGRKLAGCAASHD